MTTEPDAFAAHCPSVLALIARGQLKDALHRITLALVEHPHSNSALYAMAMLHAAQAQWDASKLILLELCSQHAPRFDVLRLLASSLARLGESQSAQATLEQAFSLAVTAEQALELSVEADHQGHSSIALRAVKLALQRRPSLDVAHLQHARVLQSMGNIAECEVIYRELIAKNRLRARAWFALMDLKTTRLSVPELQQLAAHFQICKDPDDKALLAFALGKALEDAGHYVQAFERLAEANRMALRQNPWNAQSFASNIDELLALALQMPAPRESRGGELLFLVGLPRSGTTLVEQVLAAHPLVCGAGELPFLPQLIAEESAHRGKTYPSWLAQLTDDDAKRLGDSYLRLSSRWRLQKPISTDKLPENWQHIGLIHRILPDAKIIDCMRDPTETTWSCYKQLFAPQRVPFSYRFEDLGAFWHGYRKAMAGWAQLPTLKERIYVQSYERLIDETDAQVRALLSFCGLEFDEGCLSPHLATRSVHTPSAAQVRQPMRAASLRTPGYGELMQPLRQQFNEAPKTASL